MIELNIIKKFLPVSKYARPGLTLQTGKPTHIAVHYVGGAGGTAEGVCSWFNTVSKGYRYDNNSYVYASSHYVVGLDGEIIQMIPENEISYCTNQANGYTISIENCHPTEDGHFNKTTYDSLVKLCADICKRYNLIPEIALIRHYDVTKKACPKYWAPNGGNPNAEKDWISFKIDVKKILEVEDEMIECKSMYIDGKEYENINQINKNGRIYVELISLKQAGYNVGFNNRNKVASFAKKPEEIQISVNGKDRNVNTVLIYNENYIRFKDFEKCGMIVEHDERKNKLILIC